MLLYCHLLSVDCIRGFGGCCLSAAGSQNLSTFVSAEEKVLRQQLLETGVVGMLDIGQN